MADSIFFPSGGSSADEVVFPGGSELSGNTANQVDLANGSNAQTLKIFKTTDGAGNDEELALGWDGTDQSILSTATGTGTVRNLALGAGAGQWRFVPTTGDLRPISDGASAIGATNKRVATLYANAVDVGAGPGAGSAVALAVAAGYKVARGATAFDGSNPTTVATGLATVVAMVVSLRRTTALLTGTAFVTHAAPSGANVDVYAWDVTGNASTGTETFDWIAVGT